MTPILRWSRILGFAIAGGVFGYLSAHLLSYLGVPFPNEHPPTWMAVLFAINGAIVAVFGWKYWVALGNDAADLVDEQDIKNKRSDN